MEVPCEMLLHPELLTNEQLKLVIQQRKLKVPQLEYFSRNELLEVFHKYCVPYGQRKYRDSGRGKILNKSRHLSPERPPKLNTMNDATLNSRKMTHSSNKDRIKPPPDLLAGHIKRIKLEPIQSIVCSEVNNSKRKMSVSSDESTPPPKKERKPITWP